MSRKDLATLVLLVVVVLVVVHLWFGSHASTNLQPFAGSLLAYGLDKRVQT